MDAVVEAMPFFALSRDIVDPSQNAHGSPPSTGDPALTPPGQNMRAFTRVEHGAFQHTIGAK